MDSQNGRIVVGYDGSALAGAAVDWATAEAQSRGLALTVMHVVDTLSTIPGPRGPSPTPELAGIPAEQVTAEGIRRAQKTSTSIEITPVTHHAQVAYTLIDSSRDAALLVVGTRGQGEVAGAFLGSVAVAVSAHALCPVVVVRGDSTRSCGPDRPVVVAVDGSPSSIAALHYAADVAARASAPLVIVSAYLAIPTQAWAGAYTYAMPTDGDPSFATMAREAADKVTAALATMALQRHPELVVRQSAVEGPPTIALAAAAVGAALFVVGSRGHGGFVGLLLGSVSHAAIHSAPCPVAVIRDPSSG
jgi:nucleotide-binding universal stress UspA family protein